MEQEPKQKGKRENIGQQEITLLQGEIESLERVLESKKVIDRTLLMKVVDRTRKTVVQVAGATALLSLAVQANHIRTRHDIIEKVQGGEKDFQHEDPETTLIINYLLGKAELPQDQKILAYREKVRHEYKMYLYPVPEILDSLNETQLQDILLKLYKETGFESDDAEERVKQEFEEVTKIPQFSQEVSSMIWRLQKSVGAPKIRWANENIDFTAKMMDVVTAPGRAFYDPFSNTIYISLHSPRPEMLAEEAHAKQFNDHPHISYARFAGSWLRTLGRSVTEFQSLQASYRVEYERSGSLESEAHTKIEKEILEGLYNAEPDK